MREIFTVGKIPKVRFQDDYKCPYTSLFVAALFYLEHKMGIYSWDS